MGGIIEFEKNKQIIKLNSTFEVEGLWQKKKKDKEKSCRRHVQLSLRGLNTFFVKLNAFQQRTDRKGGEKDPFLRYTTKPRFFFFSLPTSILSGL